MQQNCRSVPLLEEVWRPNLILRQAHTFATSARSMKIKTFEKEKKIKQVVSTISLTRFEMLRLIRNPGKSVSLVAALISLSATCMPGPISGNWSILIDRVSLSLVFKDATSPSAVILA